MGKEFGWGDIKESSKGSSFNGPKEQNLYMTITAGSKSRVRFFGVPKARFFAWYENKKWTVPEELINEFETCTKVKPRLYYVANVFDREDTKQGKTRFKLLEKGPKIFQSVKTFYEETEVDPGGKRAPDFLIKSIAGKDIRSTTYEVIPIPGEAPFSEKELELIDRPNKYTKEELQKLPLGERGPIDLEKFYDLDIAEKRVRELLDGKTSSTEDMEAVSSSMKKAALSKGKPSKAYEEDDEDLEEDLKVETDSEDFEEEVVPKKKEEVKKTVQKKSRSLDELLHDYK